ncbi:helix-turn-helix transcriptional regulator [Leptolyngbya sp. ST-U4]|uniref:helix-turn-helix domain-containing protein n=1 Tax=Leptolyngbya sp. ST-U4 TaxID=2933912 RepID=UPI003296A652
MSNSSDIADLVLELRQQLGLTQEELAARLGVSFPTINRWENGRNKPSRIAVKLIRGTLEEMGELGQELLSKYFT